MVRIWVVVLLGLIVVCPVAYLYLERQQETSLPEEQSLRESVAEIQATEGNVRVRRRSQVAWNPAAPGQRLWEGDLIQTGDSGSALVVYAEGASWTVPAETIFSVRGGKSMTTGAAVPLSTGSVSRTAGIPAENRAPAAREYPPPVAPGRSRPAAPESRPVGEVMPTLVLQRIVPFGSSLELIGLVDAGARLTINGEPVDVKGDGSFKHFTKPFRAGTRKVELVLKATDLAGNVRTVKASANLRP